MVESRGLRGGQWRATWIGLVVSIAVLIPAVVATPAQAASPVLEFTSASPFPINFTADGGKVSAALTGFDTEVQCTGSHGEGVISGPRSTVSIYVFTGCETVGGSKAGAACQSTGANPNEIRSPLIQADLVFIDQAKREVGMVLNPNGGTYLDFKCGGESVKAIGSFLSPVGPLNQATTSFSAILSRSGTTQIPNEYENANGEKLKAIPTGEREGQPAAATGVELSFMIHPAAALSIKAISRAEVEAKQRDEEAAAMKKRQEEEAAAKKRQEEEQAKSKPPTRAQKLSKALERCRKLKSHDKRAHCEVRAKKKYGHKRAMHR